MQLQDLGLVVLHRTTVFQTRIPCIFLHWNLFLLTDFYKNLHRTQVPNRMIVILEKNVMSTILSQQILYSKLLLMMPKSSIKWSSRGKAIQNPAKINEEWKK